MNPMRPKDPADRVPGWLYELVLDWEELQGFKNEYGDGGPAQSETSHLDFALTLNDAQSLLALHGHVRQPEVRPSSPNRWRYSDGEVALTLRVVAVPDEASA